MSRTIIGLALIYIVRMLGLFMVLPVIAVALEGYDNPTPALIGLALGIYGATQGLLQFPLAALSDRLGRKPIIAAGILLFALGSLVAGLADSVWGVVIGRALQGSGAVAATVMALMADLTPPDKRARAMALIGSSIGVSFALAMVFGPAIHEFWGLSGIFYLSAILGLIALIVLFFVIPNPQREAFDADVANAGMLKVVFQPELLRANVGVFALHCALMAIFLSVPKLLEASDVIDSGDLSGFYLLVIGSSFLVMLPLVIMAEVKRRMRSAVRIGAAVIFSALLMLYISNSSALLIGGLWLFFVGFNLCEALLPSLVSKLAPAGRRGAAMGGYSTSQFLGAFAGGALGGVAIEYAGTYGAFIVALIAALVWLFVLINMAPVSYLKNGSVSLQDQEEKQIADLQAQPGVEAVRVDAENGRLYFKYDSKKYTPAS